MTNAHGMGLCLFSPRWAFYILMGSPCQWWVICLYSLMYEFIAFVSKMHAGGLQILAAHSQTSLAPDRKGLAHFPMPLSTP